MKKIDTSQGGAEPRGGPEPWTLGAYFADRAGVEIGNLRSRHGLCLRIPTGSVFHIYERANLEVALFLQSRNINPDEQTYGHEPSLRRPEQKLASL